MPPLPPSETHVWYTFTDTVDAPDRLDACRSVLSAPERERCDAFYFDHDRHDYLLAHALVRTTLSRYADLSPSAWRFVENDYGRPDVDPALGAPPLRFNLSHTRGLVACAVTLDRDVGVDVEDTERDGQTVDVAGRFFAPSEVDDLHAVAESRQPNRFYDYWTLKEAYIKARGMGLSLDLETFAYRLVPDDAPIRIAFDDAVDDDPTAWQFALWSPSARYRAALAVRTGPASPPTALRVHETVPFGDATEVDPAPRTGPAT